MNQQNSRVVSVSNLEDPTENVQNLLKEAIKRQDDLRAAETRRVDNESKLRAEYNKELDDKEASRLNSIRQVDVLNQASAAKSALDAIQALASTTTVNADNIRNALNATTTQLAKQTTDLATTLAAQNTATANELSTRIAALEKASAEGVGKERVVDPITAELLREVKSLRDSRSEVSGKSQGISQFIGWILAGIAIAGFVISKL